MVSVNFQAKADFSKVDKMLNRFGSKASSEYAKAVSKTSLYGVRELKETSPVVTGRLRSSWKLKTYNRLAKGIINITKGKKARGVIAQVNYAEDVNEKKRKTPSGAWAKRIASSNRILRSKKDGYKFVDKAYVKIQAFLDKEVANANKRIMG